MRLERDNNQVTNCSSIQGMSELHPQPWATQTLGPSHSFTLTSLHGTEAQGGWQGLKAEREWASVPSSSSGH